MRKTILIFAFCLLGWGASTFAQQGSVAAGGTASGSGGTVTYTVGETNYINTTGSGGSINQGLQQPFDITTNVNETTLSVEVGLYPNPTNAFIILNVKSADISDLRYQLFDINGRLLVDNKVNSTETNISMFDYASATYFLKVVNSKNESKQFKIVKN